MLSRLTLVALLLLPGIAAAQDVDVMLVVGLEADPCPWTYAALRTEVESLMEPFGALVGWRALDKWTSGESYPLLTVIRVHGQCDATAAAAGFRSGPLGRTHVSDGEILPFLDVDCDDLRGYLAPRLRGEDPRAAGELLGRALGRIVAHELYHVLAHTRRHGRSGVTKPTLSLHDLCARRLTFDSAAAGEIGRALTARIGPRLESRAARRTAERPLSHSFKP